MEKVGVKPIKILHGLPPPQGRYWTSGNSHELRLAVMALKDKGDYFVWDKCHQAVYRAANQLGVKVRTRKVDGQGVYVWKVG